MFCKEKLKSKKSDCMNDIDYIHFYYLIKIKKPNGVASGSVVDSKDDGCMYPGGIATEVVVEQF